MTFSPDAQVYFHAGPLPVSATLVFTWLVMALLVVGSLLITRGLTDDTTPGRWQQVLEVAVSAIHDQIHEVTRRDPEPHLAFVGTLFLYIATCNLLAVVPGFQPPTASLSTTTALALCVFLAVPLFGIANEGLGGWLRHYIEPTPLMLPFNLVGELSRTLALAVRLYGNIMSGTVIAGILLSLVPFFFPVVMQLLGLVTGLIQAYIFSVLAMVYIASAASAHEGADGTSST